MSIEFLFTNYINMSHKNENIENHQLRDISWGDSDIKLPTRATLKYIFK